MLSSGIFGSALASELAAQSWSPPFNHNGPYTGTDALLHPYRPWGAPTTPLPAGTPINPLAGMNIPIPWPQPTPPPAGPSFNAVHMALIPKGAYQGMVLVWNIYPVAADDPPPLPSLGSLVRSFQPYAVVDPADVPANGVRYHNFLLPLDPFQLGVTPPQDLFCAGHTWSPFGDLIVAGGTTFAPGFEGARLTYAFNPNDPVGSYPSNPTYVPYPNDFGLWVAGPMLEERRWYPTVTLTHPLQRTLGGVPPREREIALVLGGSDVDPNNPTGQIQAAWNTFESLIVDARATQATGSGLVKDFITVGATDYYVWPGPGTPGNPPTSMLVDQDWFEEYPRCHLLTTGEVFFSGYAPRWARMDPEQMNPWTSAVGPPFSSNWQAPRHDGSHLLFPNLGGQFDRVLRIGGADVHFYEYSLFGATDTVESIVASATNAVWQTEPSLPNTNPPQANGRYFTNAVILPDASILLVGGANRLPGVYDPVQSSQPWLKPLLFQGGVWNTTLPDAASVRDYHSTAVLLPDGRVFTGGGNNRSWDYQIFNPRYRTDPTLLAQRPGNVAFVPPLSSDPDFDAVALTYGATYTIVCDPLPTGVVLDRVVLVAPGSTTHHSDMNQRHVQLPINQETATPNQLEFTAPANSRQAPRGIYMLFLVTNSGAVSNAQWVYLP